MVLVTTQKVFLPFHKSIIKAIQRCDPNQDGEIALLFELIQETEILDDHHGIIDLLEERFGSLPAEKWERALREVTMSIMDQKLAHPHGGESKRPIG